MPRVAVIASHPIQYQAPWFRALAAECDLIVFFCHRQDARGQAAAGFGQAFDWDLPLLDGYRSEWLENVSSRPGVDRFGGCDTPAIRSRLASGRFDACIVNGWYLKSYLQAIRSCRALGIPVLVRGDSHLKGRGGTVKSAVKYLPYRWMLTRIDAHLYVGRANYAYLRHFGVPVERLFFAPHFVENERFRTRADQARRDGTVAAIRRSLGATTQSVVFLFAGKLIAGKRTADFIHATAEAARRDGHVRGIVVGSGPEEQALRSLAEASGSPVTFAGFKNQSEIPAWYAAADCLVLPSAGETWGLVVNEAMATGAPAIVSDAVGCAEDLIDEGRTGFTFPMGSIDALADRMHAVRTLLASRREEVRAAVADKVAEYSCANATSGTLKALSAVSRGPSLRMQGAAQEDHA